MLTVPRETSPAWLLATALLIGSVPSQAQPAPPAVTEPVQVCEEGACILTYEAVFFQRYAPVTALDMVNNLPGFQLRDGDTDSRGFGGAAGNVIINGARISAKNQSPTDFLGRIPAADIERIEVIRGQVGGLDLRGQNVVANVIRKGDSSSGAWSAGALTYDPSGGVHPFAEVSYTTTGELGELTLAVVAADEREVLDRDESVLDGNDNLLERRDERYLQEQTFTSAAINGSATWGAWQVAANMGRTTFDGEGGELSRRRPVSATENGLALFQGDFVDVVQDEIGADAERALGEHWRAKLIGLYREEDRSERATLVRGPIGEPGVTETETFTESLAEEFIGRLELDYSGFEGHTVELSVEVAENTLTSDFALLQLEGGALVPQIVPGAETEVVEERVDLLISDSFRVGELSIDAALGAEDSTIRQVGGFTEDRSLFFWKPSLAISYSPSDRAQWRLRALRNVGQLDLQDFVSGADLGDVELALGNPQLSPEATATFDLSYEVRGDGIGIGSLTLFHDVITDVNDLLPLTGQLEIPGNIGDGTRTGLRWEFTLPLDDIGLNNGRVDVRGRWQTSDVDDPLDGRERQLSGERDWFTVVEVRQDLIEKKLAWGALAFTRDRQPFYGLDEFDRLGQRRDMDVFIETRAIDGLLVRLTVEDIFRDGDSRDRRVFAGDRSLQPLSFRELREQSRARTISLEFRGEF